MTTVVDCPTVQETRKAVVLLERLVALLHELARVATRAPPAEAPPPGAIAPPPAAWLEVARGELGQRELRAGDSARIVEYHASTTARFQDDETPWCSSFVNWVMKQAGFEGTDSPRALSWRSYGDRCDHPVVGAIAVIDHGDGRGHVGFVVGREGDDVVLLGGNQQNEVRYATYPASVITDYRLPPSSA